MTVYFLAYLFGNRQIYEHRRTHGSFSWLQRDSKRGFYNFRRILISGVFDLQFSVMLYKLWMYFLSKPMHLLLISLAKIVPIYKIIRTEISPEFYPFSFVTSNINYRYGYITLVYSIIHDLQTTLMYLLPVTLLTCNIVYKILLEL